MFASCKWTQECKLFGVTFSFNLVNFDCCSSLQKKKNMSTLCTSHLQSVQPFSQLKHRANLYNKAEVMKICHKNLNTHHHISWEVFTSPLCDDSGG